MSSLRGVADIARDMTALAERQKKRARSARKRKIDEVSTSSTVLPPIAEVEGASASQTSQEEPVPVPAPEVPVRAPSPKRPVGCNPARTAVHVDMWESDSAVNDPLFARRLMKAVALPSDKLEMKKLAFPNMLEQYSCCIAQANTIFESTSEILEEIKVEAEKREATLEAKFRAFREESTREYQLLQDELVRVNGLLSKAEEEARHSKEALEMSQARCKRSEKIQDELKRDLENAKELAVSEFRNSDEFEDLVGEVALPAFFDGFEDCQNKAREKHPQVDLSSLVSKYGTKEELLGDGGEAGDEVAEEELQEKPQEDPALRKGKAVAVEVEEKGCPSSQDELTAFTGNPDFADLIGFVAYMVKKDQFWGRMFAGYQEKGPGFEKPPLQKVYKDPRMAELQEKFGSGFVMNMAQNTGLFIFAFGIGYNKCLNKVKEGFPEVDSEFLLLTDLDVTDLLADTMKGDPMAYIQVVSDSVNEYGRLAQTYLDDFEKRLKAEDRRKKGRKKKR